VRSIYRPTGVVVGPQATLFVDGQGGGPADAQPLLITDQQDVGDWASEDRSSRASLIRAKWQTTASIQNFYALKSPPGLCMHL
jgi:hypothetical protein